MRNFSVVISTRDRASLLGPAIESVIGQDFPRERYEIIVVDNGSRDATREVVNRCAAHASVPVIYSFEERPGVSFARNRGASLARHQYVAFLDDDAEAGPGWLTAFEAAVDEHGALVVGGRVEPVLEQHTEPPPWWDDADIRGLFGLDHGAAVGGQSVAPIRWPLWLGGGNTVYAARLLEDFGGFRTDFGPKGARRRVAEDIDLNVRLELAGVPIHYAHDAVIRHVVTSDRLSAGYIRRRAYWAGRTDAAAQLMFGRPKTGGSVRQWAASALRSLRLKGPARTLASFRVAYSAGYLLQSRGVKVSAGSVE
jgi:glycosyltransferase involved in cell wall biosynthesis